MARRHYYLDNEEIAEADAFDENGIIRDGVTTRFPIFMTDSSGNVLTDAMGAPLDPSYTRRGYVFTDNINRERPIDNSHPDVQKAYIGNAWKNGVEPGDVVNINGRQMIGTHFTDEGSVEFVDVSTLDGDELKKRAFDEYRAHLSGAWKKQKEPYPKEWECAGPLSDSESSEIKEQAWRDSVEELSNVWRK